MFFVFFFPAEDGIRVSDVTGVQTCALPISGHGSRSEFGIGYCQGTLGKYLREEPNYAGQPIHCDITVDEGRLSIKRSL